MLFQGQNPGEAEISGRYCSVSLRIALEMVEGGEAEPVEVNSPDNGAFTVYVETEFGVSRRMHTRRQIRDLSCSMGPRVMEGSVAGVAKYRDLVNAWYSGRHIPVVRQRCREQVAA